MMSWPRIARLFMSQSERELRAARARVREAIAACRRGDVALEVLHPEVADSPVWGAAPNQQPLSDSERQALIDPGDALVVVLAAGERYRRCPRCRSIATQVEAVHYESVGDDTNVVVRLDCGDCSNQAQLRVQAAAWGCMEAMRAWEGIRTAQALFTSQRQGQADLDALDEPR